MGAATIHEKSRRLALFALLTSDHLPPENNTPAFLAEPPHPAVSVRVTYRQNEGRAI
jgi:hypothetical protein